MPVVVASHLELICDLLAGQAIRLRCASRLICLLLFVLLLVGIVRIVLILTVRFLDVLLELVHRRSAQKDQTAAPVAALRRGLQDVVLGLGRDGVDLILVVVFVADLLVLAIFIVFVVAAVDLVVIDDLQLLFFFLD